MNKLEIIFQKMETINKEEAGKVVGGLVVISPIADDVACNAAGEDKDKDKKVSNTGFLCGLTLNVCR